MRSIRPYVELRGIKKSFGAVQALSGVDLQLRPGECIALVGENGAGKSTLMKILSGVWPTGSYEGQILGETGELSFTCPRDAMNAGIAIVHQELALIPELSVCENIFLGDLPAKWIRLDRKKLEEESQKILHRLGLDLQPQTKLKQLSIGQQQLVEIARAFRRDVKVLVLDEPTSALSGPEIKKLFELIEELKKRQVALVYISHKLDEVREICDRAVVLRDGASVASFQKDELSDENLISAMVGRKIQIDSPFTETRSPGEIIFEVKNLSVCEEKSGHPILQNVSFVARRSEIVGIAGLMGSKRTELLSSLFGIAPGKVVSGQILFEGKSLDLQNPRQSIESGMAYLTEDRKHNGLLLHRSILENFSLPLLRRKARWGLLSHFPESELAHEYLAKMNTKMSGLNGLVRHLSGGNQQKVLFARWLATQPKLLLLDEPTRGIDVGAKQEIYRIVRNLADEGMCILMVSSELPEIIQLSDRVLVMRNGEIASELSKEELSQEGIMRKAVA